MNSSQIILFFFDQQIYLMLGTGSGFDDLFKAKVAPPHLAHPAEQ